MRLSESQIQEINYAYSYYRKADLKDLAHKMENDLLNDSISLFSLLPISPNVDRFNDIKRVTINKTVNEDKSNSRLFFIENLKYPPLRIVYKLGYNRASFKEQSIFYGGFGSQLQLLFENPPEIGDKITLSTWKQKNNSDLCFVSIFHDEIIQQKSNLFEADWKHFQEELSHLDPKTREALRKLFSLVTYFFMRPVKKENSIEYIFSAYIADKIFKMNYSPKIEAILTRVRIVPTYG